MWAIAARAPHAVLGGNFYATAATRIGPVLAVDTETSLDIRPIIRWIDAHR
jgi:hypothetical protein